MSTTTESDIALHVAGRSLRNQAHELRREHPIRSFLAFALRVHTDEKAWDKGAVGEEKVGKELEKYGKRYFGLRTVICPRNEILDKFGDEPAHLRWEF